jgi:hypothetical protein
MGCSSNESELYRSSGLIPLAMDNIWNYDSWGYDTTGTQYELGCPYSKVIDDIIINNSRWFILENRWETGGISHDTCLNQTNGYYRYNNENNIMIYKYPAILDEEYVCSEYGIDFTRTLTSLDTTIITPAGDFHCLKYYNPGLTISTIATLLETEVFVDRNIGIIKWIHYKTDSSGTRYVYSITNLTSYILN